ncbi:nucleotide exchange factor GrpE, partial [Candidatus Woesearchaeota archaeon]|nr:nucleotide exchange factor GrpE [Candidatus Woesearchaeota archaeon]
MAEIKQHDTIDIENLKQSLNDKSKQAEDYLNTLKRVQADFENFIKRTDNERKQFIDFASAPLITKLLTFLDDFDHMLASPDTQKLPGETLQGLKMIHDKFLKLLTSEGVKPITCAGKADPYLHEVILTEQKEGTEDNVILQELQKGY